MGIFTELKKLFWASSSVAKSAADKGFDMVKDAGEDMLEKSAGIGAVLKDKAGDLGEDLLEKSGTLGATLKDKAGDLSEDLLEKSGSLGATLKDKAGDLGEDLLEKTGGLRDAILHSAEGTMNMVNKNETLKKAVAATEKIGEQVLSKGEELLHKGEDAIESIGSKILGEDNANLEKIKDFTEDLGDKVMDAKDNLVDKAEDVMEDIQVKIDETLAKGKKEEVVEAANPTPDLQEILDENEGSLLEGEDDFFKKAAAYAEGDYHGAQEGKITIQEVEVTKKEPAKAAGFTDHDGDGNEMVDDAIIETVAEVKDVVGEAKSDVAEEITKTVETTGEDGAIAEVKVDDVVKEVDDSIDVIYEIVEGDDVS